MQANFSSGVEYADGNGMGFGVAGKYCDEGKPGAKRANIVPINAPGVFGGVPKNYGGGTCRIRMKVWYIAGSEDECESQGDSDNDKLGKATSDLTLGPNIYKSCQLVEFDAEQPRNTGLGTWRMVVNITVDSMNPWNS